MFTIVALGLTQIVLFGHFIHPAIFRIWEEANKIILAQVDRRIVWLNTCYFNLIWFMILFNCCHHLYIQGWSRSEITKPKLCGFFSIRILEIFADGRANLAWPMAETVETDHGCPSGKQSK